MMFSRGIHARPGRARCAALVSALALIAGHGIGVAAQSTVLLWPNRAPHAVGDSTIDRPSMAVFLATPAKANGTGVVIFPGGGYTHLATEKEGTDVARWLNGLGVSAFVVTYRLGPRYRHPAMLEDAQRAVRLVRAGAARWGLDPGRIGVMGFSAGGHMASTAGTHFGDGTPSSDDPVERAGSRPDFMVLVYPVITMDPRWAHRGSRANLLGETPTPELVRLMSNETQVTPRTPPAFIVGTTDDATVPIENSLMFYEALEAAKVPAELHVFESGRHGFGLAAADPALAAWLTLCEAWMRRHAWVR